jgi:uncharacterized protein YaeQ
MALKPTIYKSRIALSDSDRNCFEDIAVTLALHPSENLERLTARLLAFCLSWNPALDFTKGLSSTDEPDIWQHSATGEIEHWIEVGQPDPTRLKKACGRAQKVSVYAFGSSAPTWWNSNEADISALPRLSVWLFPWEEIEAASRVFNGRTSNLSISIVGSIIYLDDGKDSFQIEPTSLSIKEEG